jgi:ferritin-like metal-binding protein YciE
MSTIPGKAPAVKLPPQVETPRDLLLEHLGKLLTVEDTLVKQVLPKLVLETNDGELKSAFAEHLEETRTHVERVKGAFAALDEEPRGKPALGLDGLRVERDTFVTQVVPALRPAADCEAAMGTEHYEINVYDAAIRLADELTLGEVGDLLRANLADETAALAKLAEHADRTTRLAVEQRTTK